MTLNDEVVKIKPLLKEYVEKSSGIPELHWDQTGSVRLLFDPYDVPEREKTAHYFLLVSALDTPELVSRSENAKALMISAHSALSDDLFKPGQAEKIEKIVQEFSQFYQLGRAKDNIPEVLNSVNLFVQNVAKGDLIKFANRFSVAEALVKKIGKAIPFMGGQHIDHAWMYLRWMVRPYPDLHVFESFSCKQLQIPLTSNVRNVAYCLGLCKDPVTDWSHPARVRLERGRLTKFAAELFPEDPAKIDYPFYVLGRWMRDEKLSPQLLRSHLQFWKRIYDKLRKPPITFDAVSRNESTFEKSVREELEKLQFMFLFEPYPFSLPEQTGVPQYRPDFVLPRCRKKGRIVILEPHGIWTPLQKRVVTLGKLSFPIWATPARIDPDETMFVNKLRAFREVYKDMYYLILIVPPAFTQRIETSYSDIYDELYDGTDIPKLLYELKKNME
jgi:hypothetical protein